MYQAYKIYKEEPQILTAKCKLITTPEQSRQFENLSLVFSATCNYINASVDPKHCNAQKIQKLIYTDAKSKSSIQANHVIQACIRVAGNRKKGEVIEYKPGSVPYDVRTFRLIPESKTVSLSVLNSRVKVGIIISDHQAEWIVKESKISPTSATLVKRRNQWYLHIQFKVRARTVHPETISGDKYLGINLGRKDIAALSDRTSFSGENIEKVRTKYSRIRARLQHKSSKGTRSSRRRCRELQKRLAGKDRRFQAWLNHNISLRIVLDARASRNHLVLEDLEGIREGMNKQPRSREQRFLSNSWSFYQLKLFIQYKANIWGIPVILVSPRYTSQTCHNCLHIHPVKGKSYRNGKDYHCKHCGWKGDADYNAANVIQQLGATVNRPCGSEFLACNLSVASIPGLLKAYTNPEYRV